MTRTCAAADTGLHSDRRSFLSSAALATLIAATATTLAIAGEHPDAELLRLGAEWRSVVDAMNAHAANPDMDHPRQEVIGQALFDRHTQVFDAIMAAPAMTLAGLEVKARMVVWQDELEAYDDKAAERMLKAAHFQEHKATAGLVLDVLRLAKMGARQ